MNDANGTNNDYTMQDEIICFATLRWTNKIINRGCAMLDEREMLQKDRVQVSDQVNRPTQNESDNN